MIFRLKKQALIVASAALVITGALGTAEAGPKYGAPGVIITVNADGSGSARGTLGGTRNTPNNVESLSCGVKRTEILDSSGAVVGTVTSVRCFARNASNQGLMCTSLSDAIGNQLNGISNDSLVEFYFDSKGNCTSINNFSSSSLERKKP